MRILHFVDAATTDETFVSSDKIQTMRVTGADSVILYFQSLDHPDGEDLSMDFITLTATAKSEVVALRLAEYMVGTNIGGPNVLTIVASTAPFTEVSVVAFSTGA